MFRNVYKYKLFLEDMSFLDDLCQDFVSKRFILFPHEKTPNYGVDSHSQLEASYSKVDSAETFAIIEKDRSECKWLDSGDERTVRVNIAAERLPEYLSRCNASNGHLSQQAAEKFLLRTQEIHPTNHLVSESFNNFTYQDAVDFLNTFYPPRV